MLGNPEKTLKTVHIAGTNGKGTTALIIDNILKKAGYKVGRFTSPHINSYSERITVNGQNIDAQTFYAHLLEIENKAKIMLAEGLQHPTEFEVLTAAALKYFQDCDVDIAVLEAGMGGIYDSTNVIIPLLSIITSIDLDHQRFLGDTLEEIALNKAGIIKNNIPVVIGKMDNQALKVIEAKAHLCGSPLYSSSSINIIKKSEHDFAGQLIDIRYPGGILDDVHFPLWGDFNLDNLSLAIMAIQILQQKGFVIENYHIKKGVALVINPGRIELINNSPPVFIDVAHNPHAAKALVGALADLVPDREKILVFGVLDDKDSQGLLAVLGKNTNLCIITKPVDLRSAKWLDAMQIWKRLFPDREVMAIENINEAVKKSLEMVRENEYILITGSFYVAKEARRYFIKE